MNTSINIIRQILEKIRNDGFFTIKLLAQELSIEEKLLQMMIEDLRRDGYLAAAKKSCDIECKGCSGCHLANVKEQYHNTMELTQKSLEYLKNT